MSVTRQREAALKVVPVPETAGIVFAEVVELVAPQKARDANRPSGRISNIQMKIPSASMTASMFPVHEKDMALAA
ncbi:hypothetical protein CTheo_9245 [Ceratobasidium theobromae]|uniref:Uncharacterized protein n=1 Tax=Ceratobasidium theobromae TaxID=1582974 RepID=A0A5N5Q7E2_9AGAM|nr:hypothetical protein CTheo_9245 [Ceratobasidium theobromae]